MLIETLSSAKFKKVILGIGLAAIIGGLCLFTYLSLYNRYWADDWCYNADLKDKGFWGTLAGYAYDVTYTPSRYSVSIFAGLLQIFQVIGVQAMTPLTIWLWVVGLIWLFWNVARLAGFQFRDQTQGGLAAPLVVFFSALIVYFSIFLTPQLYQSLYWRTGLLTYTTPLVLTTWVFVLITRQGLLDQPSKWETALAGFLSLLAGGCSEAAVTVLVSSLAMYVGLAAWGSYRKRAWAQKTFWIGSVSLFFAIVAMCLLIFAPTTQIRQGRYGMPTPLAQLPRLIFNYTYAFFVLTMRDYFHILIALLCALAGFTYPIIGERSFKLSRYILLGAMVVVVSMLLVAASLTPSIYIEKGLPAPRTMIIPTFIAVSGFALGGWIAGAGLKELFQQNWLQAGTVVLFLLSPAFPMFTILQASKWIPIYTQRTQAWDARNAIIESALKNDLARVMVKEIDGVLVGGIRDFDPPDKKGYWITQCAADFYGIKLDVMLP